MTVAAHVKAADRLELLRDADYFATELTRRIEALAEIEPSGRTYSNWQQAAALTRRVRGLARHQADEQRRKANRRARDGHPEPGSLPKLPQSAFNVERKKRDE